MVRTNVSGRHRIAACAGAVGHGTWDLHGRRCEVRSAKVEPDEAGKKGDWYCPPQDSSPYPEAGSVIIMLAKKWLLSGFQDAGTREFFLFFPGMHSYWHPASSPGRRFLFRGHSQFTPTRGSYGQNCTPSIPPGPRHDTRMHSSCQTHT
jgi:hypothetical protein